LRRGGPRAISFRKQRRPAQAGRVHISKSKASMISNTRRTLGANSRSSSMVDRSRSSTGNRTTFLVPAAARPASQSSVWSSSAIPLGANQVDPYSGYVSAQTGRRPAAIARSRGHGLPEILLPLWLWMAVKNRVNLVTWKNLAQNLPYGVAASFRRTLGGKRRRWHPLVKTVSRRRRWQNASLYKEMPSPNLGRRVNRRHPRVREHPGRAVTR
jgi:hypothetical protein